MILISVVNELSARVLFEFFRDSSPSYRRLVHAMEISFASNKKFYASVSILNEMGCCEILEFPPSRNDHTKHYPNNVDLLSHSWNSVEKHVYSQKIIFLYASHIYFLCNNSQIFFCFEMHHVRFSFLFFQFMQLDTILEILIFSYN